MSATIPAATIADGWIWDINEGRYLNPLTGQSVDPAVLPTTHRDEFFPPLSRVPGPVSQGDAEFRQVGVLFFMVLLFDVLALVCVVGRRDGGEREILGLGGTRGEFEFILLYLSYCILWSCVQLVMIVQRLIVHEIVASSAAAAPWPALA